jgi:hypothetical protein
VRQLDEHDDHVHVRMCLSRRVACADHDNLRRRSDPLRVSREPPTTLCVVVRQCTLQYSVETAQENRPDVGESSSWWDNRCQPRQTPMPHTCS